MASRIVEALAGAVFLSVTVSGADAVDSRLDFFERRIRPVLVEHCEPCHGDASGKRKGGLKLDTREGLLKGGDTRPAVVPGDPSRSLMVEAVRYGNRDLQMPPKGRLPDVQVADLERWIADGAVDPRTESTRTAATTPARPDPASHWAFQPLQEVVPPAGDAMNPVDRFVDAALRRKGFRPTPVADRLTLLRRLSYDLTGLPPSPELQEAFLASSGADGDAAWVDRLMATPAYGERWARWWLDVARYADTNGQDENKVMANAWRYRDWVVRAFNRNLPFDLFITEQLAGDLLPTDGVPDREVIDRWTATGFLILGPKMLAEQDKPKLVMDLVDEQIDTVGRAFLGLTLGCARCHDHKFDPIPTRDYYALAGIFKSTRSMANLDFVSRFHERRISPEAHVKAVEAHAAELRRLEGAVKTALSEARRRLAESWVPAVESAIRDPRAAVAGLPKESGDRLHQLLADAADPDGVAMALRRAVEGAPGGLARFLAPGASTGGVAGLRLGPGRVGAGFVGTGSNRLEIPDAPALEPDAFTVEAWVKPAEIPTEGDTRRWLVAKGGNEWVDGHYALLVDGSRVGAYLNCGGGRENVVAVWSADGRVRTGAWHHLALTFDGRTLRIFADGEGVGDVPVARPRPHGSGPLVLGFRPDGHVGFRGMLDEVRVHRRVLSLEEIRESRANPGKGPQDAVVARWDFDALTDSERRDVADEAARAFLTGPDGILTPSKEFRPLLPATIRSEVEAAERAVAEHRASAPAPVEHALAVEEATPVELPVHIRGSHLNLAKDPVPRGFVQVVQRGKPVPIPPGRSGRLELAAWLTGPDQPLTARVIVNRVWQAHFGEGLVRTPDNFGLRGEAPSHPELLDWLAVDFIRSGWDLRWLHRRILTSAAWRRAGAGSAAVDSRARAEDPEDRWLAWFPRQRLEAEMVRDALLAVSDRLDPAIGGTLVDWKNDEYTPADTVSAGSVRRSLYLPVVRDRVYDAFTLFDFANPSVGTSRRVPTVVSHQALFFLNSPLVKASAAALAARVLSEPSTDAASRVDRAFRLALGRPATGEETAEALAFVREVVNPDRAEAERDAWAQWCQVLLASNEFLYRE